MILIISAAPSHSSSANSHDIMILYTLTGTLLSHMEFMQYCILEYPISCDNELVSMIYIKTWWLYCQLCMISDYGV